MIMQSTNHQHYRVFPAVFCLVMMLSLPSNSVSSVDNNVQYRTAEEGEGRISGHVQNWATLIQNYILQLASDGLKTGHMQHFYDVAKYNTQQRDGQDAVDQVKRDLEEYFKIKEAAAKRIEEKVVELYDKYFDPETKPYKYAQEKYKNLFDVPKDIYKDSDVPKLLPENMQFNTYFKQNVSMDSSTVKISDEVQRHIPDTINSVLYTRGLEEVLKNNTKGDPDLRWQYFGAVEGLVRQYPGREWSVNFAGFYKDYDPRVRPWFIAATSGPKDVVIILDCSHSMLGKKFNIAKSVVRTVMDTLTKQDYVNVICARASHWDEVGKWHPYSTQVLSCKDDRLVPATTAHRKDLKEKTNMLVPGGTSELKRGFEKAFELLAGESRTGCQAIIVLVTDGKDTDGEHVRCGPGYYTRSGYVPGPICKYVWEKVWHAIDELNPANKRDKTRPPARIFSYLTISQGEEFPGKIACNNRGDFYKLNDGENLIRQMDNYFRFLSTNTLSASPGLWTDPYLDAWGLGLMVTYAIPAFSHTHKKVIGVVGVDATLDEIENKLTSKQWGSVYSFLIDTEGESIFHPLLKPSSGLVDDPIFIHINSLEQSPDNKPEVFGEVVANMTKGITDHIFVEDASRAVPKGDFAAGVKRLDVPATYYYTSLNDSVYSFAFVLAATDKSFRRLAEPEDRSKLPISVFNTLIEYNSTLARKKLQGNLFKDIEVFDNEAKYPNLRVSYKYSSFRLSPKCYCNPNEYLLIDDLDNKTVRAHEFMNGYEPDVGCPEGRFEKNTRADILVTSQIEEIWKNRNFDVLKEVKWTYIGCSSGVFRTYPGHRSSRPYNPTKADILVTSQIEEIWKNRNFDVLKEVKWTYIGCSSGVFRTYPGHRSARPYNPTKRPWYHKVIVNPDKTGISTAYMDAAGVGKIISISQALYEGMVARNASECENKIPGKIIGGCECNFETDCASKRCYKSKAAGYTSNTRCASERVEAVTSLDILYNDFHHKVYDIMKDEELTYSCGNKYTCPNGEECQTRCYLFDTFGNVVCDPTYITVADLHTHKYNRVPLGRKEGEIMHELIYVHRFFVRQEAIDFQGSCSKSPGAPRVNLVGKPRNPEELDNFYKTKGPIPPFSSKFGCIQDVVGYAADVDALGPSGMIIGNVSGPCKSGFYYLTALPKTNLFLLVVENWQDYKQKNRFFNFNCHIMNKVSADGAFRIINGTCAHEDEKKPLAEDSKCPAMKDREIECKFSTAMILRPPIWYQLAAMLVFLATYLLQKL